jgi:nicotinamidase-related amidase
VLESGRPAPINRSALLVIDVQESFAVLPRWSRRNNPAFEANVARLLKAYRAAALPVIFFLHSDSDAGFKPTSPHYRLLPFLTPRDGEPLLHKTTRNCFTSTNLQSRLVAADIRRLVITGIQTEQCCETTARVGGDFGYDVDFVTEATRTFPIPGPGGAELDVDAIVERTEYVLRGRFARIATVEEIVAEVEALGTACAG